MARRLTVIGLFSIGYRMASRARIAGANRAMMFGAGIRGIGYAQVVRRPNGSRDL